MKTFFLWLGLSLCVLGAAFGLGALALGLPLPAAMLAAACAAWFVAVAADAARAETNKG